MSSRFTLVDKPALEPAEDLITRSTVGPFVDCGAWVQPSPRKRRVYLSVDTIRELAEAAGIVEKSGASETAIAQARALGALDVIKEGLNGDLVRTIRRLGVVLADLPDVGDHAAERQDAADAG